MMLTANAFYPQHIYTPPRPSPLSERSANAVPRPFAFNFSMASPVQNEKKTLVPQRAYKPNPVVQMRDAATQRRRDLFFRRVQKDREDKKWDARGEQIQRLDYISERKRWEAEKVRQSPQLADGSIEEEVMEVFKSSYAPSSAPPQEQEVEEADYLLAQEEYELQDLIASMEENQDNASQHYGSDDEDYDQIFMECTSTADMQSRQQQQFQHSNNSLEYADAMDMSED